MVNNIACIYVYLDYAPQDQVIDKHDGLSLLSTLFGQLVRQRQPGAELTQEIKTTYASCKERGTKPTQEEILKMFNSLVKLFAKVFVVIDALDESVNDSRTNTQDNVLNILQQCHPKAHLLFTTRPDPSIEKRLQPDAKLKIRADPKDIKNYLEYRIKEYEHLQHIIKIGQQSDKRFLDKSLDAIVEKTKGMSVSPIPAKFEEGD